MTWHAFETELRKVHRDAYAEPSLYMREWVVGLPVKVKGAARRMWSIHVADSVLEDSGIDVAALMVRCRWLAAIPKYAAKVRRARMRMERAARKRRRGWA